MRVEEAVEFRRNFEANLAAEADPALRGWYQVETSLSPEYQDATKAIEELGDFATGLQTLLAQKEAANFDGNEDETVLPSADEVFLEEYVSPEERKRRSVVSWVETISTQYKTNLAEAKQIPKQSKREKKINMAKRQFARQFEYFGPDKQHILFDLEAFTYAVEALADKPALLEAVTNNTLEYARANRQEVLHQPVLLADMARKGFDASDPHRENIYSKIFSALTREHFRPEELTEFRYCLADASLELVKDGDKDLLKLMYEIADFGSWSEVTRTNLARLYHYEIVRATIENDSQAIAKTMQTDAVFSQIRLHILRESGQVPVFGVQLTEEDIDQSGLNYIAANGKVNIKDARAQWSEYEVFINSVLHFDPLTVIDVLDTNAPMETERQTPPPAIAAALGNDRLFQRRMELLAPLAYANELTEKLDMLDAPEQPAFVDTVHTPISPNLTITTYVFMPEVLGADTLNSVHDTTYHYFASENVPKDQPALFDQQTHALELKVKACLVTDEEGRAHRTYAVLRPTLEFDRTAIHPIFQLTKSFTEAYEAYQGSQLPEQAELNQVIAQKRQSIFEKRNRFIGRRPVSFQLPQALQATGLNGIAIRRHEDGKQMIVDFDHQEGMVQLTYDENLELTTDQHVNGDRVHEGNINTIVSSVVMTLLEEWSCREVMDTSDGRVSASENAGVNMGHFSYLGFVKGKKKRFSATQADACRREQGLNLAIESIRRQALDPSGQGRNSTYVREQYDPNKSALEVHYDPTILEPENLIRAKAQPQAQPTQHHLLQER